MHAKQAVLITGGAGFIGSNLTFRLLRKNFEVHLLCKKETNLWRLNHVLKKIKIHSTSLSDKNTLVQLLKKINPAAIFHLAAYGVNSTQNDVDKMIDVNIQSTYNLLFAAKDINYKVFVNAGSSSEYGFKENPMKETDFLEPNGFYSVTKASATYLCQVFAKLYNKPIVCVRLFSVYGPYEEKNRLIPTITENLFTGKSIKITEKNVRHDFIYIEDVVNALMKMIKKGSRLSGEVLNIGSGKEYTNLEVVRELLKVTRLKVKIENGEFKERNWDHEHWVADNSLAKKLLSWTPKFPLEAGLLKTYKWFVKNYPDYETR